MAASSALIGAEVVRADYVAAVLGHEYFVVRRAPVGQGILAGEFSRQRVGFSARTIGSRMFQMARESPGSAARMATIDPS
jgi:hypothetical protein